MSDRYRHLQPYEVAREIVPEWLTAAVKAIAGKGNAEITVAECRVLADALEDAGCKEESLLWHLRCGHQAEWEMPCVVVLAIRRFDERLHESTDV